MKNDNYKKAFAHAKEGKDYSFKKFSTSTGLESLYYTSPIKINKIDKPWLLFINAPVNEYLKDAILIRNFSFIASLMGLLLIALVVYFSVRTLKENLLLISSGLESFFMYLNKDSQNSDKIHITSNDEFGLMAEKINENVVKIQNTMNEDNLLLDNVKGVANKVSLGKISARIEKNSATASLNELKDILNEMLNNLESFVGKDINNISDALSKYTQRDFTAKLDTRSSGKIGNEIIEMNRMITHMLQSSEKDGTALEHSSHDLSNNVSTLSKNASSQAASLEETAASIDEITSNIEQTSLKSQEMSSLSNATKSSAIEGKKLANDTVNSMDDINNTVISINEAITVIDQIAFQTNILSLNAAVEAATAGEAGKGFAVVAQEVRNLASRSAEAAKEIKNLVQTATLKANNGKEISKNMIEGFAKLEEKINLTNNLIDDVTHAAKEQSVGMTQIADAIGQLDQFTQENAAIAERTNTIAKETKDIAKDVVSNVAQNKFEGQDI